MADTPPLHPTRSRHRPIIRWAAGVVGLTVVVLLAAAVIPGAHSTAAPIGAARRSVVNASPGAPAPAPVAAKVADSSIAARRYGTQVAQMENGVNGNGQYISDLSPLAPGQFARPVAEYRAYAERWAVRLGLATQTLSASLRAGDRTAARHAWTVAFSDYLHLGAVYGLLPASLNDRLAEVPPSTGDTTFPGLHRIEKGLWTGQAMHALVPVSVAVSRAIATLRHVLPRTPITPLVYATRAHEILEDAQRDLLSGTEVPWSHEGVLGTEAGLAVTRKVISTLVPLLNGRDNTLGTVQYWLAHLGTALASVRRADGTYPTLGELSPTQRQLIDGTLAGTDTALSAIPGTLEVVPTPTISPIPTPGDR
jgi:high-affinity iron transporter